MPTDNVEALPYRPCVGIMLVNKAGFVFTGERIDTPGAWQMPQGGIDKDETHIQAAYREMEEEIGVTAKQTDLITVTKDWVYYDLPPHLMGKAWGGRFRGQQQMWFKMLLTADDTAVNIKTAHPEFSQWKWSTTAQLANEIVDFKKDIYRQIIAQLT